MIDNNLFMEMLAELKEEYQQQDDLNFEEDAEDLKALNEIFGYGEIDYSNFYYND